MNRDLLNRSPYLASGLCDNSDAIKATILSLKGSTTRNSEGSG